MKQTYLKGFDMLLNKNAPIGIFDSGVGGLTVVREVMAQMPQERIIYFGDTARVPYGNKSKETVTRFSKQIVNFLSEMQVKTIVIACNTASATALPELEELSDIPIIGVVKPGAKAAAAVTENGKVGVIGTEGTIRSQIYSRYLKDIRPGAEILYKACPLFVPLVEEGLIEDPVTDEIARRYLMDLIDTKIDTLIMGCTHYPMIRKTLQRTMGENVKLVDPAYETARECRQLLKDMKLENDEPKHLGENSYRFYVSDETDKFIKIANTILSYGILGVKKIDIEKYDGEKIIQKQG